MKIYNKYLLILFILQPFMHADENLFSSVSGWVSRNISTMGICIGFGAAFTAFNEYRMKQNNAKMLQQTILQSPICTHTCATQEQVDPLVEQKANVLFQERDKRINTWIESMNQKMSELFKWQKMHLDEVEQKMPAIAKSVYDKEQDQSMKKLLKLPQVQKLVARQPKTVTNYTDLTHAILLAQHQRITILERGKMNSMNKMPLNNNFITPQSDLSSSNPL